MADLLIKAQLLQKKMDGSMITSQQHLDKFQVQLTDMITHMYSLEGEERASFEKDVDVIISKCQEYAETQVPPLEEKK